MVRMNGTTGALSAAAVLVLAGVALAGCTTEDPSSTAPGVTAEPSDEATTDGTGDDGAGDSGSDDSGSTDSAAGGLAAEEFDVAWDEAVQIAQDAFDGRLTSLDLDEDDGRFEYQVTLASSSEEFEATIDPNSGEIVQQEREALDSDDAAEVDDEAFELAGLITPDEAMTAATAEASGPVSSWSLDRSWSGILYDVEIGTGDDGPSVSVDAETGAVVEVETDD